MLLLRNGGRLFFMQVVTDLRVVGHRSRVERGTARGHSPDCMHTTSYVVCIIYCIIIYIIMHTSYELVVVSIHA